MGDNTCRPYFMKSQLRVTVKISPESLRVIEQVLRLAK
jgi:hypothetical protein